VTPGLVFAADGARYGRAIGAVAARRGSGADRNGAVLGGRASTPLCRTAGHRPTPAVDAAMQATGPDTIVKFLFTSGSTKLPKAVINTQACGAPTSSRWPSRCPC
jgi:feruloyl-CoA synthase